MLRESRLIEVYIALICLKLNRRVWDDINKQCLSTYACTCTFDTGFSPCWNHEYLISLITIIITINQPESSCRNLYIHFEYVGAWYSEHLLMKLVITKSNAQKTMVSYSWCTFDGAIFSIAQFQGLCVSLIDNLQTQTLKSYLVPEYRWLGRRNLPFHTYR